MIQVSASLLSADFAVLGQECSRILDAGADMLHYDVMDGHFVPNISYGVPVLASLRRAVPGVCFDAHLMITDPEQYAPQFIRAGADWITFHLEAVPDAVPQTIDLIHRSGARAGASIRPGTPVEALFPYLELLDLVLIMGVEPGFGGQKFLPETPARIAAVAQACAQRDLHPVIQVDGGINAQTAALCTAAGANNLVMGSALFGASDPTAVVRTVKSL